jgi:leader peptidase (prepilin peptidase) / N-methyltransferase
MPALIIAMALLGLAVGSFLNVVIYRVPRGESLLSPASNCPSCDHPVRNRHNVPVISWLMLRGRCADCAARITLRYVVVELLTALLFVAVTIRVAHLHLIAALPAYLFFAAVGIVLTAIDLDVLRLPNSIVYPSYLALGALLSLAALIQGGPAPLIRAAIGGGALFAVYFALALAYPVGMGFGDVKLAGVIGAALGFLSYSALVVGAFAAFLIGACIATAMLLSHSATRKTAMPFGPFMVAGALVAFFASVPLSHLYSRLVHQA